MIRMRLGTALVFSILGLGLMGCEEALDEPTPVQADSGTPDVADDQSVKPDVVQPEASPDVAPDVTPDVLPDNVIADVVPEAEPEAEAEASVPQPSGEVQILTINDFHGQLDPLSSKEGVITSYYGGIGYLSTYFKEERAANPNTVIINGGDEIGASPTLSAYGTDLADEPAVRSLNFLGLTASNLGNHNFDHGTAHLKALMDIADYAYVGANVNDPNGELGDQLIKPFHMVEFGTAEPKIKVAIIGLSNPETPDIVLAGQMGTVTISEPLAAANAAAEAARNAGAHIVIGSAHVGAIGFDATDQTLPVGPLADLAKQVKGFDLIQGGHTEAEFKKQFGDTWVVQGPARGHAYYRVKFTLTDGKITNTSLEEVTVLGQQTQPVPNPEPDGGALNCSTGTCPTDFTCVAGSTPSKDLCVKDVKTSDPDVVPLMAPWKAGLKAKFDVPLGTIDEIWIRDGKVERSVETKEGDMIADAILDTYKPLGVQIAFMNGGGIRDSLPSAYAPGAGTTYVRTGCSSTTLCDLLLGDVYAVIPFGNSAVLRTVKGNIIWEVLEFAVSTLHEDPLKNNYHGRFQQVAGLRFTWKLSNSVGSRLQSVELADLSTTPPTYTAIPNADQDGGSPDYTIIVNDFMNGGGDGFTMLKEPVPTPGLGILADAVVAYIKDKKDITTPAVMGRITMIP